MKQAQVQDYKRRLRASRDQWPLRLERFVFENIPSVGSGELPFPSPIVVLAGPNGVGKTTLLRALWAAAAPSLARDDAPMRLKLSSGKGSLTYALDAGSRTTEVSFTKGAVKIESSDGDLVDVLPDIVHLDSSEEARRQQANFCAFSEVEDLINGIGFRTLDARSLEEINYVSRRDYREVRVYEIENEGVPLPFFEVSYGNDRYDSRTMGAGEVALFFLWWSIDRASQNAVLLIEEPESHLSPASQQALSHYLLKAAVEKHLNVVLTSHSHRIISSFSEDQLVFLFREGGNARTRVGIPPPALLSLIGMDPHTDVVVLVEDKLAEVFLRQMLERIRPSLSRRIEISVRNGHGDITSLLLKLRGQFKRIKILGCYDGDMRTAIPDDVREYAINLPGDKALEAYLREMVTQQPALLVNATGSQDVPAILAGIEGAEHHDWYTSLCRELGLSQEQLFPTLFNIWMNQDGSSDAATNMIGELTALIAPS